MDRERTFFFGFIAGVCLMSLPIPEFFFWRGITEHVTAFFRYSGFILLVVCGVPLIASVLRALKPPKH